MKFGNRPRTMEFSNVFEELLDLAKRVFLFVDLRNFHGGNWEDRGTERELEWVMKMVDL